MLADQALFNTFGTAVANFTLFVSPSGYLYVTHAVDGLVITAASPLVLDTWYSLCLERVGNVVTLYIDGVAEADTWTVTPTDNTTNVDYFAPAGRMYLDECRITEQYRYNGNYTPRTTPFPNSL